MEREEALELINTYIKRENLIKHALAVEAIMKNIAKKLGEDEKKWGIAGLLHDIDFEETFDNPALHGIKAGEILSGKVEEDVIKAIRSHNFENNKEEPESKMDFSLIAADSISGLIIACALVLPSRKLNDLKLETIERKFKQKDFARNCSRERILYCEKCGISLKEFFEISLEALKSIAKELGL